MRFYVPEWDDAVDARYDFVHDELSTLHKSERDRAFIWDVFDEETTPIDGVLISREQVENSTKKFERLTTHGVYDDPELSIPDRLPTISDCGAWGYKSLPFPPYGNEDMLEFYEQLDVTVGVTIDHLVLGSGKEKGRLYLDERAFGGGVDADALPSALTDQVDVMIEEWPSTWPPYVEEYAPGLTDVDSVEPFVEADFDGSVAELLRRLDDDPRAVYRENDKEFRYNLTLENAREMWDLYEQDDWSFRLMAAFQGWDPTSYGKALQRILEFGYQYVGIGGVAGSQLEQVEEIVREASAVIDEFEQARNTRIDTHVFGFAKSDGFETIGRGGMSSFDSASMLRSAWTGGNNYRLGTDQFDAIRVRYSAPGDDLAVATEKSLRAQEALHALRAFDRGESIAEAIDRWHAEAAAALDAFETYLREHRHDDRYDASRLRDLTAKFRDHFEYGRHIQSAFSDDFRRLIVKLLREDDPENPIPFGEYVDLLETVRTVFERYPRMSESVATLEEDAGEVATFEQVWAVVEEYATSEHIDDGDNLEGYRETLRARPWDRCDCPICEEYGVEVATFRGNNRNRRRGFHNTHQFYRQFTRELPRILVTTKAENAIFNADDVESFLTQNRPDFWTETRDLPVVEIGTVDANGVHEWWEDSPTSVSLSPDGIEAVLEDAARTYDTVVHYEPDPAGIDVPEAVTTTSSPEEAREQVLSRLGYEEPFLPERGVQIGLGDF